jgi:hypothetical protein
MGEMDECVHDKVETRLFTASNKTTHVRDQCLICGKMVRSHKKDIDSELLPAWDYDLQDRYWNRDQNEDQISWL